MAYRHGDRLQSNLFPASLEDYVKEDDVVRAYDALIEALDLSNLKYDESSVGNPRYDPVSMLKLLVYGYSYGVRSSRKLERACHHNVSFMWLVGGLKPDHKTISEFRRNNKQLLKSVLKQSAKIAFELGLIEGNTLFVDSSKIRGNASVKNSWTEGRCSKALSKLDARIEEIIKESEELDSSDLGSLVTLSEELVNKEKLKSKVSEIAAKLKESAKNSINTVDEESVRQNSVHGSFAGYNVQSVVDEKEGLIVSIDATSKNNDINELSNQLENAEETLGKQCSTVCADSGYSSVEELEKVDNQGIRVVVPSQRQASSREKDKFDKSSFKYDANKDCYTCPEGETLSYSLTDKGKRLYQAKSRVCKACRFFGQCTSSKNGRRVSRLVKEDVRLRLEKQYLESQAVYKKRKEKVELPFGHIKRNLKLDAFLLRGREGVNAEASILATCFNVVRMIKCRGIKAFISAMQQYA